MNAARKRKGDAFKVRVCRHCGRKTRGPAHFRHEQACGLARGRTSAARARRKRVISQQGAPRTKPTGRFFEQLRRLVQNEIRRQLGLAG